MVWHTGRVPDPHDMKTDPVAVLSDLHDAADAVLAVFDDLVAWGPSGGRDDQYASDVVADRAIHGLLDPLGYGVLSEESGLAPPTVDGAPVVVVG